MRDPTELQLRIKSEGIDILNLDLGIKDYVAAFIDNGIETFASCEGGKEHAFPNPTIRFGLWGADGAMGFRALSVAIEHGFPVDALRQVWSIENDMPVGPFWEITFFRSEETKTS